VAVEEEDVEEEEEEDVEEEEEDVEEEEEEEGVGGWGCGGATGLKRRRLFVNRSPKRRF
jgi:hypothetical protein